MIEHHTQGAEMPAAKIAITLDRELLREVDREVKGGAFRNRSKAIEEAVREKLERQRKRRVLAEAKKLNPKEEKALAEEGITGEESAWPAY
jgi:Arc/MetJ-type ribon-helix-helix transcriptional regulator